MAISFVGSEAKSLLYRSCCNSEHCVRFEDPMWVKLILGFGFMLITVARYLTWNSSVGRSMASFAIAVAIGISIFTSTFSRLLCCLNTRRVDSIWPPTQTEPVETGSHWDQLGDNHKLSYLLIKLACWKLQQSSANRLASQQAHTSRVAKRANRLASSPTGAIDRCPLLGCVVIGCQSMEVTSVSKQKPPRLDNICEIVICWSVWLA